MKRVFPRVLCLMLCFAVIGAVSCSSVQNDYCRAPNGLECLNVPEQCSKQPGCSLVPGCAARKCSLNASETECAATETCRWSAPSCLVKNLTICDGLDQATCGSHAGCVWDMACVGRLEQCAGKTESECTTSDHCTWERVPDL
jgi:hypothetical protein